MKQLTIGIMILVAILAGGRSGWCTSSDPWADLQKRFEKKPPPKIENIKEEQDPWAKLRAVFLPFSFEEEKLAVKNDKAAGKMAGKMNARMHPYEKIIKKASTTFNIPQSVIKSVIMAESGADPYAKAKTTSAKGLMQTIDSTFKMARNALTARGIYVEDDPFDPNASIMAGSWYLDRMYEKALADKKMSVNDRNNIASWRYPLEYYYAGPGNGAKPENKILVFSNGTRRVIDKRAYSKKIQTWAAILERT